MREAGPGIIPCSTTWDVQVMASEGMAASIIRHKVIDEGRLRTLEGTEARSALVRVRHTVEAYTSEEGRRAEDRGTKVASVALSAPTSGASGCVPGGSPRRGDCPAP